MRAPFGIALQGIRDNPRRMNALGYNVVAHRVAAYALAGLIAAVGGILFVWYNGLITPGSVEHLVADQHPRHRRARRHEAPDRRRSSARSSFVLLQTFAIDVIDRERFNLVIGGVFLAIVLFSPDGLLGLWAEAPLAPAGVQHRCLRLPTKGDEVKSDETNLGALAARRCGGHGADGRGLGAAGQPVKIGLLATLEGPFAAGGADGMRGAELAVKQRGGVVAGRKIEIIKASSDAKPDVAVNATRKLVEQDKVDIMVGPLSGGEGIAVKDYSKTQPQVTFINGGSGAQATTLVNPSPNFFRFNTEGAQWMVGLGKAALAKGYKRVMVIAEDYAFPYSQVQGFMSEYCRLGGKVPEKAWVPLGGKDYSSVIAKIPKDVDALLVVLGGADAVNFLNQYEVGRRRQADPRRLDHGQPGRPELPRQAARLAGRHAVGRPAGRRLRRRRLEGLRRRLPEELPGVGRRLPEPEPVRLRVLREHEGGARRAGRGQGRPVGQPGQVPRGARRRWC